MASPPLPRPNLNVICSQGLAPAPPSTLPRDLGGSLGLLCFLPPPCAYPCAPDLWHQNHLGYVRGLLFCVNGLNSLARATKRFAGSGWADGELHSPDPLLQKHRPALHVQDTTNVLLIRSSCMSTVRFTPEVAVFAAILENGMRKIATMKRALRRFRWAKHHVILLTSPLCESGN